MLTQLSWLLNPAVAEPHFSLHPPHVVQGHKPSANVDRVFVILLVVVSNDAQNLDVLALSKQFNNLAVRQR